MLGDGVVAVETQRRGQGREHGLVVSAVGLVAGHTVALNGLVDVLRRRELFLQIGMAFQTQLLAR